MQKIRIDFDNPGLPQHISAVENDSQSRFFQATLYENGKAYTAPEGATYSIMYRGFGPQNQGWYDTINDGAGKRAACAVSGNVVTCEIARQALQVPGHVSIVLCVTTGKGYMLKSWPIECDCKNDRYDSTAEIQSFFYITQVTNADWTQAIQAVEELKNTIDPTLSVSGKAADAAKVGEAVGRVEEDLRNNYDVVTGYHNVFMRVGGLSTDGIEIINNDKRLVTSNYISVEKCVSVVPINDIGMYWWAYDENKSPLGHIETWRTGTSAYAISKITAKFPSAIFFRMIFRKNGESTFNASEVYSCVNFRWNDVPQETINARLLKLEEDEYKLSFYDETHNYDKSIINNAPVPFCQLYDYGEGSLQDIESDDKYFYMAFTGGELRKVNRTTFQVDDIITNDLYNHVINMYFLPNKNLFVASKMNDESRIFVEVSTSDFTTVKRSYDLPNEIDNKVPMCVMKKDDNTIISFYATTGTTYPKSVEVYKYTINPKENTKISEFLLNTRYGQGCTVIGNVAYIMFNKGYLSQNIFSEPFILLYDINRFESLGKIYLDNFGETEGVCFGLNGRRTHLYFCENGTHVLYDALVN